MADDRRIEGDVMAWIVPNAVHSMTDLRMLCTTEKITERACRAAVARNRRRLMVNACKKTMFEAVAYTTRWTSDARLVSNSFCLCAAVLILEGDTPASVPLVKVIDRLERYNTWPGTVTTMSGAATNPALRAASFLLNVSVWVCGGKSHRSINLLSVDLVNHRSLLVDMLTRAFLRYDDLLLLAKDEGRGTEAWNLIMRLHHYGKLPSWFMRDWLWSVGGRVAEANINPQRCNSVYVAQRTIPSLTSLDTDLRALLSQ